jgi:outer-membrane receptor for ferric coprogen and ferric-rhodotorulic acid
VGASVYWQDEVYADITTSSGVTSRYTQDSYATLNLMANYAFDAHWSAALNLNNITNEKYLASLMWAGFGQSYYAAPRSGMLTLSWKY